MDQPLDDRIAERQNRGRGQPPRRPRASYPRDGVRKSTREDRANLDNDWVHDRYDDDPSPNRGSGNGRDRVRRSDRDIERRSPDREVRAPLPAKLRVDNLHYDLTEDDIHDLFTRIAPVREAKLTYDRAGRSEGVAFVIYDLVADARSAIREFDGANAKGQPIRITLLPPPPRAAKKDNPFDRVQNPRSLFDRVEAPSGGRGRRRSESPIAAGDDDRARTDSRRGPRGGDRRSNIGRAPPENIDRYVPGQNGRSTSRRDGRRPGERKDQKPPGGPRPGARPKKTAEQLDAEMEDYWGSTAASNGTGGETAAVATQETATATITDDIDMIE